MVEFILRVIFTIVGVILLCLLDEIHDTDIKTCIFILGAIFLSMFVILIYNL